MLLLLILLFVLLPILELWLLIQLGTVIGPAPTIAIVVLTGVAGALLVRLQGIQVLRQIQKELAGGQMPAPQLLDGLMIIIAAVLLLTPGLMTDAAGFALLIPAVRAVLRKQLRAYMDKKLRSQSIDVTYWEW